MRYLVTGKEMTLLDKNTSEHFFVPSQVLMEQAAMVFVRELLSFHVQLNKVLVVCGNGNNGGDGLAIARLLNQQNIMTSVYLCNDERGTNKQSLYEMQKKIYRAYGFSEIGELNANDSYDLVIDAIFGTGLSRQIDGAVYKVIEYMNRMNAWKVAVDISSGVSADNGEVLGIAFQADHTFTFSFEKIGQYIWPGSAACGCIRVLPIGITESSFLDRKPQYAVLEDVDYAMLPKRIEHSNKGSYGKLLVIAGGTNMAGAAYFSAKAAYRMGVGLVKILTSEDNRLSLQTMLPEAILSTYGKTLDEKQLVEDLKWADAVVFGPGIGTGNFSKILLHKVLHNISVPLLIDADGLNLLAEEPELLLKPHMDIIVTPHLGEMARLNKETVSLIQTRLVETAQEFAMRYDVICVLKDSNSIVSVPYQTTYLNLSGNHGMATAGSGDVLSGVIGSLLAQGVRPDTAAPLGVYIHGKAGDAARDIIGARAMIASDIIDALSGILCSVE